MNYNDDMRVRVAYKNREMRTVSVQEYDLRDYTDMIRLDLMKIISDVEELVAKATGVQVKEEWNDAVLQGFLRVKHKLLDKAGEVGRLPGNIIDDRDIDDDDDEEPLHMGGLEAILKSLEKTE